MATDFKDWSPLARKPPRRTLTRHGASHTWPTRVSGIAGCQVERGAIEASYGPWPTSRIELRTLRTAAFEVSETETTKLDEDWKTYSY